MLFYHNWIADQANHVWQCHEHMLWCNKKYRLLNKNVKYAFSLTADVNKRRIINHQISTFVVQFFIYEIKKVIGAAFIFFIEHLYSKILMNPNSSCAQTHVICQSFFFHISMQSALLITTTNFHLRLNCSLSCSSTFCPVRKLGIP